MAIVRALVTRFMTGNQELFATGLEESNKAQQEGLQSLHLLLLVRSKRIKRLCIN